jgi:hypothetical protein
MFNHINNYLFCLRFVLRIHLHGVIYLNFCNILSSTEHKFHVFVILTFLYLLILVQW